MSRLVRSAGRPSLSKSMVWGVALPLTVMETPPVGKVNSWRMKGGVEPGPSGSNWALKTGSLPVGCSIRTDAFGCPANAACWASSVAEASCWVASMGEKAELLANRPIPSAESTPTRTITVTNSTKVNPLGRSWFNKASLPVRYTAAPFNSRKPTRALNQFSSRQHYDSKYYQ